MSQIKLIKSLLKVLESNSIISSLTRSSLFFDEPQMYEFTAKVQFVKKFSNGLSYNSLSATGTSFFSTGDALLRCLGEAAERFCLITYKNSSVKFFSYEQRKADAVDPYFFTGKKETRKCVLGWVESQNLISNSKWFVPAQLVYLNFHQTDKEPFLSTRISTGAAGGSDKESAITRGIYEIVERDAYMTNYLNKISSSLFNLSIVKSGSIKLLLEILRRYKLEWFAFDTTNDLCILSVMSIVVDRTGIGPAVSVGIKSGDHLVSILIASLSEALMVRSNIRTQMGKMQYFAPQRKFEVKSIVDRGLYWSPLSMISKLNFLLKQRPKAYQKKRSGLHQKRQLHFLKTQLEKKNHPIYAVDITAPVLKKVHYYVYKILIPSLHPVYLHETRKEFRLNRLREVAEYFGEKNFVINHIPHPFL